jgi:hypothetical protein
MWGSHGSEDINVGLLGSNNVWTCWQIPTFQRNILPPTSGPKMEAIYSSETSASSYKSIQWYYPEDQHEQSRSLLHVRLYGIITLKTQSTFLLLWSFATVVQIISRDSLLLQKRNRKAHLLLLHIYIYVRDRLTHTRTHAHTHMHARVVYKLWCGSHALLFFTINATNIKYIRNCEILPPLSVKFNVNLIHCIALF